MTQRIDVIVDGRVVLRNQRSDNDAVWNRIRRLSQTVRVVEIRRHAAAAPPPPPPPVVTPPVSLAVQAQSAIVWAHITDDALAHADQFRPPWRHWISADAGVYAGWFSEGWPPNLADVIPKLKPIVARLRQHGCPVQSWSDCRTPPDGTSAQTAIDLARILGLDGWVGQAEDPGELEHSVGIHPDGSLVTPQGSERAKVIIGNPNAWTQKQRDTATKMVNAGDLAVAAEVYRVDPGYSSQGVPVASVVYGVAMDGGTYYPLTDYNAEMPRAYRATYGVWHGSGLQAEAWTLMGRS